MAAIDDEDARRLLDEGETQLLDEGGDLSDVVVDPASVVAVRTQLLVDGEVVGEQTVDMSLWLAARSTVTG